MPYTKLVSSRFLLPVHAAKPSGKRMANGIYHSTGTESKQSPPAPAAMDWFESALHGQYKMWE